MGVRLEVSNVLGLFVNAALLFAIWQQLSVVAEVGGGAGGSPCETDQTKYSLDTNDDGDIDLSDFVFGLSWFFQGTEAPRVCLATDDLEARVAALEAQHPPIAGFTFVETNAPALTRSPSHTALSSLSS